MIKKLSAMGVIILVTSALACERSENANNANRTASTNSNTTANANAARTSGVSDAWITAKTKLALIADQRTSGFATDVDTNSGTVTLSGKVDNEQAKAAGTEVTRGIDGVKNVNNQLQVVPDAKRKDVNAADDKIEDNIKKATDTDPNLKGLGLSADSNAGVVTLSGTVDTHEQLVNAAQAIRKIAGVKGVVTTPVTVRNERKS
jgi:hyperosmotically inducible periplasmic protein